MPNKEEKNKESRNRNSPDFEIIHARNLKEVEKAAKTSEFSKSSIHLERKQGHKEKSFIVQVWKGEKGSPDDPRRVFALEHVNEKNKIAKLKELLNKSGFFKNLKNKCKQDKKEKKNYKIIIKPNIMIATQKAIQNYTDPALVDWLVDDLNKKGYKNVRIVESENLLQRVSAKHTPQRVAKGVGYKHPVINLTDEEWDTVKYKEGKVCVSKRLENADYIINFAKGRNHPQRLMTGAIKNMFGSIPPKDKMERYHWKKSGIGMEDAVVAINNITSPDFTIIDMVKSVDYKDEHATDKPMEPSVVFKAGMMLAGQDPLSIDKTLSIKMGYKQNESPVVGAMADFRQDFDIRKEQNLISGTDLSRIENEGREWKKVPLATRLEWGPGIDIGLKTVLDVGVPEKYVKPYFEKIYMVLKNRKNI
jgi:uncharacterized protein (DUF362 family)